MRAYQLHITLTLTLTDPLSITPHAESGAPRFDECTTPLDSRRPAPPETVGQVSTLIDTFIDGYWGGTWVGRKPPRVVVAHQVMAPAHFQRPYTFKVLGTRL